MWSSAVSGPGAVRASRASRPDLGVVTGDRRARRRLYSRPPAARSVRAPQHAATQRPGCAVPRERELTIESRRGTCLAWARIQHCGPCGTLGLGGLPIMPPEPAHIRADDGAFDRADRNSYSAGLAGLAARGRTGKGPIREPGARFGTNMFRLNQTALDCLRTLLQVRGSPVDCAGPGSTDRMHMACKRPGVRVPLAPLFFVPVFDEKVTNSVTENSLPCP